MRGSLAVWYDAAQVEVDGHAPRLDLHFNIWCDLPGQISNVLDVGLIFKEARPITRLFFYIPGIVGENALHDLSPILEHQKTLAAVFNDTLTVGAQRNDAFEVKRGNRVAFHIVRLSDIDRTFDTFDEEHGRGTVIRFEPSLFAKMTAVGDHYIRFRIPLGGALTKLFISDVVPSDRIFASSFYRTEMIEFRVNEKRNFSDALKARYPNMSSPAIGAIQYFLVRNLRVELVRAHADFRKMRRLEPSLWDRYLEPLGGVKAEEMVIYHWRAVDDGASRVDDFIALTAFRTSRRNIVFYLLGIVLLGAMGSTIQAGFASYAARFGYSPMRTQVGVFGALVILFIALYIVSRITSIRNLLSHLWRQT